MRDLFLNECRRFRQAALIAFALHLLLQIGVARVGDPLHWRWEECMFALAIYMLCGLGFALYQMGSYRQPGRWVWLLHRPLARGAIFGAIALAGCTLIAIVVGLPFLLTVLAEDLGGMRTVDSRHYLLVLQLVLLVCCAWMTGSYIIISRSRSAAVIGVLPFALLMHNASGRVMLAPALLCVGLLAYVVYASFKPNRLAPPDGGIATAATAAPLLIGFYWALLWSASLLYQGALLLTHSHPRSAQAAPAGGINEVRRLSTSDLLLHSLAGASDARAARWRKELATANDTSFKRMGDRHPVRQQLSNTDKLDFTDKALHISWTFSHDAMRFEGRDSVTGQARGWLGLNGIGDATPFPAVPVLPGEGLIMTAHELRSYRSGQGSVTRVLAVTAPETLIDVPQKHGDATLFMLTNARLIAYAAGNPPRQTDSVALPGKFGDLAWVHMAPVSDGRLVAFTFGERMADGGPPGTQTLMLFGTDGSHQVIATRALAHDFPPLFEHKEWWLSPALYTLLALPDALLDKGMVLDAGSTRNDEALMRTRPAAVWLAALVAALATACAAWAWLRRACTPALRRAGWIAACLVFGPPALPALMILQPRPARACGAGGRAAREQRCHGLEPSAA